MLAPKDYPERVALLDLAQAQDIDSDQVAEFLWLVNARPDLAGLSEVVLSLAEILNVATAHWQSVLKEYEIEWLPDRLRDLHDIFEAGFCFPPAGPDERLSRAHQWSTRNGLFDALGASRPSGDPRYLRHRLLQAHYFFAHIAYTRRNANTIRASYEEYGDPEEWPPIKISPRHTGLAVRDLSRPSTWADDLLVRMSLTEPPRKFAELPPVRVRFFNRAKKNKSWTEDRPRYIANYISQAYGIKLRSTGHGSARRAFSLVGDPDDPCFDFGEWSDWDLEMDDLNGRDDSGEGDQETIPATAGSVAPSNAPDQSKTGHEEQLLADNCPDEDDADEDSLEGWRSDELAFTNAPGSLAGGLRALSNQAIRAGKSFAFAYERLSAGELRLIGDATHLRGVSVHLSHLHHRRNDSLTALRHDGRDFYLRGTGLDIDVIAETLLFLHVMLWTGSTPERTHSLRRVENTAEDPLSELEIDDAAIRVPVPFPRYRQTQDPVPDADCKRHPWLVLPDARRICMLIDMFARWQQNKDDPQTIFTRDLSDYLENARILLSTLDPTGRLTVSKVSNDLYGRIMSSTGNDSVAAAMITGQVRRGARVPMFYACRSQEMLQRIYEEAVGTLGQEFWNAAETEWKFAR